MKTRRKAYGLTAFLRLAFLCLSEKLGRIRSRIPNFLKCRIRTVPVGTYPKKIISEPPHCLTHARAFGFQVKGFTATPAQWGQLLDHTFSGTFFNSIDNYPYIEVPTYVVTISVADPESLFTDPDPGIFSTLDPGSRQKTIFSMAI